MFPARVHTVALTRIQTVVADVDQDSSGIDRDRAAEFGFTLYDDIAEALCCGGDQLAVDAVLIIGECVAQQPNAFLDLISHFAAVTSRYRTLPG